MWQVSMILANNVLENPGFDPVGQFGMSSRSLPPLVLWARGFRHGQLDRQLGPSRYAATTAATESNRVSKILAVEALLARAAEIGSLVELVVGDGSVELQTHLGGHILLYIGNRDLGGRIWNGLLGRFLLLAKTLGSFNRGVERSGEVGVL